MSLDVDIFPKVIAKLQPALITGLHGCGYVDENIHETPWCWVMNSSFNQAPGSGGPDLEATQWVMLLRLFHAYAPDPKNAEVLLSALIEPIRDAFRKDLKLGQDPNIAAALVTQGSWGFMDVSGTEYRYCDLNLFVTEKRRVAYGA